MAPRSRVLTLNESRIEKEAYAKLISTPAVRAMVAMRASPWLDPGNAQSALLSKNRHAWRRIVRGVAGASDTAQQEAGLEALAQAAVAMPRINPIFQAMIMAQSTILWTTTKESYGRVIAALSSARFPITTAGADMLFLAGESEFARLWPILIEHRNFPSDKALGDVLTRNRPTPMNKEVSDLVRRFRLAREAYDMECQLRAARPRRHHTQVQTCGL